MNRILNPKNKAIMKELTNPELLQEKGLQLQENEDGTVTLVPYSPPLENGGKWLPKNGEKYHTFYYDSSEGVMKNGKWTFNTDSTDINRLRTGFVFPEKSIVDTIVEKVNEVITSLKREYWNNYTEKDNGE